MKKGKILITAGTVLLLTVVLITFSLTGSFAQPARPITLSYISFIPLTNFEFAQFKPLFIDRVNEKAKGELIINVRGGPG